MRILHVTDTHLGIQRAIRGAPNGWCRADDHRDALRAALEPAIREEVDLVIHSGDLFDRSRPIREAVADARILLHAASRRVPVVVMPGNHDRHGLRGSIGASSEQLIVCDQPTRLVVAGVAVAMVPFVGDADTWAAAARHAVGGGVDLLVAHQAFHGAKVPGLTFRVGSQRDTVGAEHIPKGVQYVLCGHIHPRQVLSVGDATVVMPGSTERTSFAEKEQVKGSALWTLDGGVSWTWRDGPARLMISVQRDEDLDDVVPGAVVRVHGDRAEDLERAVLHRGGWLVGPPASRAPSWPVRGSAASSVQTELFA